MAENDGAGRRLLPPPPQRGQTAERKALAPPPPPGARNLTGTMPAAIPRPDSFSGPKPEPGKPRPASANALKEKLGVKAYTNLVAALRKICGACGLQMAQFMVDGDCLIFRSTSSPDSRMPVEYSGGKPEVRVHLDSICLGPGKHETCSAILREFGLGSMGELRVALVASMLHVYVSVSEDGAMLCGSGKPGGTPTVYLFLHL